MKTIHIALAFILFGASLRAQESGIYIPPSSIDAVNRGLARGGSAARVAQLTLAQGGDADAIRYFTAELSMRCNDGRNVPSSWVLAKDPTVPTDKLAEFLDKRYVLMTPTEVFRILASPDEYGIQMMAIKTFVVLGVSTCQVAGNAENYASVSFWRTPDRSLVRMTWRRVDGATFRAMKR